MLIKETIERQCCAFQDLKKYYGEMEPNVQKYKPKFCRHCGQIWVLDSEMGPAGSNELVDKKVKINLDCW